jgi:DNA topoisomerase I
MQLVIVESPTKAKTLSKYLDKEYVIKSSKGHIRDLPKSGLGVDVEKTFEPEYVVPDKAKKTLAELKKSAKDAESIVLAPDPDREGEAIAWHLQELLTPKRGKKPEFKRIVFHELTKEALEEAFKHIGKVDMNLVDAQQARRVLDRLVGYKLSPLLWKTVRFGLSAGRVQSVAVRLIVERERERDAFNPEEYWSVKGDFTDSKGKRPFTGELVSKDGKKLEITTEKESKKAEGDLKNDAFGMLEVKKTERKKNPYPPLKTSTLQQSMANTHGFTAKKTMSAAQKLFEKGFITYHRTDSLSLAAPFVSSARDFAAKEFGANTVPEKPNSYKNGKNAQEAHEAIRPTDVVRTPKDLGRITADELKVYSTIWRRAVSSQMTPAVYDQTTLTVASKKGYQFRATGSVVKFDGWLAVDKFLGLKDEEEDIIKIPEYKENEPLELKKLNPEQHFTQPPARYSDATLIKSLEEMGIGRPSTYAPTISTIQARGYVTKEARYFVPTDVSFVVVDLLVKNFPKIVDYEFTAKLENDLDEIADGKKEWIPMIKEFYKPFEKLLEAKSKVLKKHDITTLEKTKEKCPECGHYLVVKLGKYGKFLSCSNYPECKYAGPMEEDKVLDEDGKEIENFGKCAECNEGVFMLRMGRFGKFLACSNYPKCKTAKPFLDKIGVKCFKCKKGEVVKKKAKGREFFGCSEYPDCDFSSWMDPRNPKFEYDPEKHSGNNKSEKKKPEKKKKE